MNADGTSRRSLTTNAAVDARSRVVAGRDEDRVREHRKRRQHEIYVMNADGTAQTA